MIRRYTVDICDDCLALKGEMCHRPGCVCIRMTMAEVGELLNRLLIRPMIDGVRIEALQDGELLPDHDPGGD